MGRSFLCCRFVLFTSQILGFQLVKTRLLDLWKLAFPPLGIFLAEMESLTHPIRWPFLFAAARLGGSIRARAGMSGFVRLE